MPDSPIQSYPDIAADAQTKVYAKNADDSIGWVDYPEDAQDASDVATAVSTHDGDPAAHGGIATTVAGHTTDISGNTSQIAVNTGEIVSLETRIDSEGVPAGGSTGWVLGKSSNSDYDTEWRPEDPPVTTVNGNTGDVVLTADEIDETAAREWAVPGDHDRIDVIEGQAAQNIVDIGDLQSGKLNIAGGMMTGDLFVQAPTLDDHAATKKYVDDNAGGGGGTATVQVASGQNDLTIWRGTEAEYQALGSYDSNTMYVRT